MVIVLALIYWTWYLMCFTTWGQRLSSEPFLASFVVLFFHASAGLLTASYLQCVLTSPGGVPDEFLERVVRD